MFIANPLVSQQLGLKYFLQSNFNYNSNNRVKGKMHIVQEQNIILEEWIRHEKKFHQFIQKYNGFAFLGNSYIKLWTFKENKVDKLNSIKWLTKDVWNEKGLLQPFWQLKIKNLNKNILQSIEVAFYSWWDKKNLGLRIQIIYSSTAEENYMGHIINLENLFFYNSQ